MSTPARADSALAAESIRVEHPPLPLPCDMDELALALETTTWEWRSAAPPRDPRLGDDPAWEGCGAADATVATQVTQGLRCLCTQVCLGWEREPC